MVLDSFRNEIKWSFTISLSVFLFILFFQPFPLEMLDYDQKLLYVLGFWAISFSLSILALVVVPHFFSKWFIVSDWEINPPYILYFGLFVLMDTSFSFYIRFVGKSNLELYILFKIFIICLIPIIILSILFRNEILVRMIERLKNQNKEYLFKINDIEEVRGEQELSIYSNNNSDQLNIKLNDLILINAADNYVEVNYLENDELKKKLIRNTLKEIEQQLSDKSYIIRCHRAYLINVRYIKELKRGYNGHGLNIKFIEGKIPVSRQYLPIVKEQIT